MIAAASPWMSAAEAARALGVNRATLYAYVSRGYVCSEPAPGQPRERRYARQDVERLRRRTEERRHPDQAAARALQWGLPILESSITLITGNAVYYRGYDAVDLSRSRSVEQVASLVWTGGFDALCSAGPPGPAVERTSRADGPFVTRAQSRLALAAAHDASAYDLRPDAIVQTGWRILTLLADVAAGSPSRSPAIDRTLARGWRVSARGTDVLRAALILCADHELNVSAFTARCVASSGSTPYAVVIAGLAAIQGRRHGGASVRAESMLDSLRAVRDVPAALGERLRRGDRIEGFGHPLYPGGDPRASALMDMLRRRYGGSTELRFVSRVAHAATSLIREPPNLDFALAALAHVLRLAPGTPLTIFALGRTIGWIGHAIEQYATGLMIRPRARYVGTAPASPAQMGGRS